MSARNKANPYKPKAKPGAKTPAVWPPAGFFSQTMVVHGFPPQFVPQFHLRKDWSQNTAAALESRRLAVTHGTGLGDGSVPGMGFRRSLPGSVDVARLVADISAASRKVR